MKNKFLYTYIQKMSWIMTVTALYNRRLAGSQ